MNVGKFVAASVLLGSALAASAQGQPILERVEKLVRDQLQAATEPQATEPQANEPGYLGLVGDDSQDAGRGVRVLKVSPSQPAAAAGVQVGDLVTRIDGQAIRSTDDMASALSGKTAGTKITISLIRDNAERRLTATLGRRPPVAQPPVAAKPLELPPPPQAAPAPQPVPAEKMHTPPQNLATADRPRLGVRTVPVSADVQRQNGLPDRRGAQVISVAVGSPADRAGLPLGAVIRNLDEQPIDTPEGLAAAVQSDEDNVLSLGYVYRGKSERLDAVLASAEEPKREIRARQPLDDPFAVDAQAEEAQSAVQPASVEPADESGRVEALEQRVQQLEARLKEVEAKLAEQKDSP